MAILESKRLTDTERKNWLSAIYLVRGYGVKAGDLGVMGRRRPTSDSVANGIPWIGDGPVYLGGELDKSPRDSVWFKDGSRWYQLSTDYGRWKRNIKAQLDAAGYPSPTAGQGLALVSTALAVASAVVGAALSATAIGAPVGAAIIAGGAAVAGLGQSAAAKAADVYAAAAASVGVATAESALTSAAEVAGEVASAAASSYVASAAADTDGSVPASTDYAAALSGASSALVGSYSGSRSRPSAAVPPVALPTQVSTSAIAAIQSAVASYGTDAVADSLYARCIAAGAAAEASASWVTAVLRVAGF